jgi:predicted HicB family RNase H-like nuclease
MIVMKSILLRLPDELHARVKAKAEREHRSLNAHVLHLLERDVDLDKKDT